MTPDVTIDPAPSGPPYPDSDSIWRLRQSPEAFTVAAFPPIQNWRFVAPVFDGDPNNEDGSIGRPFTTLTAALASITDAAPGKRYAVWVTGRVSDPAPVGLKANVFIVGAAPWCARVQADSWFLDASWTPAGDHRGGFVGVSVAGVLNLDLQAVTSNEGKLYFSNAWVNNALSYTAYGEINQLVVSGGFTFDLWTLNGGVLTSQAAIWQGGISAQASVLGIRFELESLASAHAGITLRALAPGNKCSLLGSSVAVLDADGPITVSAQAASLSAEPTLTGGAALNVTSAVRTPGTASRGWRSGIGTPEGVIVGSPGDLYTDANGGAAVTLWVKESGAATNTGWVAK